MYFVTCTRDHFQNLSSKWFQHGFRLSRSTLDLLAVVSDRIARVFNMSGAT